MDLKRIILFGDSLIDSTISIETCGVFHSLAEHFSGRADVLVRGFPSFTSTEIAPLTAKICELHPRIVLMGFGNSDSALPGQIQHVPLDTFRDHVEKMASTIAEHGAWPVIITPVAPNDARIRCRELKVTRDYALACRDVAESMQIEMVDLFHGMQLHDGWAKNFLLNDGLSLNANGHALLYKLIRVSMDKLMPSQSLPRFSPGLRDGAAT